MTDVTAGNRAGVRNKLGEWRPAEPMTVPPIYSWPTSLAALFKWLFGFPGFLWPWNLLYVAISVATWLFLTPPMEAMKSFSVDWIAFIFVRNLALIFLVAGGLHLRLYIEKAQGTDFKYNIRWPARDNPTFLFGNQVLENVFWTVASAVPVWTAYEVLTMWMFANGYIPYVDWAEHPVYCVVILLAIPFFREIHFYLIHRLIHWPPLYRTVHHLHHRNVNVGPWSGMSMHPVEHVLYFSGVLIHWIVPSHPLHAIFHLQHLSFAPAQGHSGFERVVMTKSGAAVKTNDYFHYLHHKYFECNYGSDLVPLDRWLGTFNDGSEAGVETMNKRMFARQEKKAGG